MPTYFLQRGCTCAPRVFLDDKLHARNKLEQEIEAKDWKEARRKVDQPKSDTASASSVPK